jgi:hypothetical protein
LQIDINLTAIIVAIGSFLVSVVSLLVAKLSKSNERKFDELFDRTKDLPAIRNDIDWLKRENKK